MALRLQPISIAMCALGVHRVVERQVVARGDQVAIAGAHRCLTYRELNQHANVVARHLIACGLLRASRVIVKMERSPQLAAVLLGVLKAGAAYMWVDGDDQGKWPEGVSIPLRPAGEDEALIVVDPVALRQISSRSAPNLPIVTRPDDIACVLPQRGGQPGLLVPHASITALQSHPFPDRPLWSDEVAALDLWLPLMAGGTVTVASAAPQTAAA
jgi:non-ribosomal peptide synthetase component F